VLAPVLTRRPAYQSKNAINNEPRTAAGSSPFPPLAAEPAHVCRPQPPNFSRPEAERAEAAIKAAAEASAEAKRNSKPLTAAQRRTAEVRARMTGVDLRRILDLAKRGK
jgi:hypothetical protein